MQLSSQFCDWKKQLSQVESANRYLDSENLNAGQFNLSTLANLQTQTQEGQKPSFYIYDERTGRKRRHDPWFAAHPHKKPSIEDMSKSPTMKRVSNPPSPTTKPKSRLKTKNQYRRSSSKTNIHNNNNNNNNIPSSPEEFTQAVTPEVGSCSAMSPCSSQNQTPEQPDIMEINLHPEPAPVVAQITAQIQKMTDADFTQLLTFDFFNDDSHDHLHPEIADVLLSAIQPEQQPVHSQDDCMPHVPSNQNHHTEPLTSDAWMKTVEEILRPNHSS